MKEHPIIFQPEIVEAILENRCTMTRRVIKPQPIYNEAGYGKWMHCTKKADTSIKSFNEGHCQDICPYGQVGDRLWVRRTKEGKFIWKKAEAEIWLEITGVRVERLQEISTPDILAEGIILTEEKRANWVFTSAISDYAKLWDSINAKRGYGWESNCWVWVISFRRQEMPIERKGGTV